MVFSLMWKGAIFRHSNLKKMNMTKDSLKEGFTAPVIWLILISAFIFQGV